MRKRHYLIMVFFLFSTTISAQVINGKLEKLAELYNKGKYEKCLFKADGYSYSEDYKRNPEPYLYMSMCFYQLSISEDELIREDYKDGFKQAVKYAGRFIKKDKDDELYSDNLDYIELLKRLQVDDIEKFFKIDDFKKAKVQAKNYSRLNREEDYALQYYIAMLEALGGSSQGEQLMSEAEELLLPQLENNTYKMDQIVKSSLKAGFLKYSEVMIASGNNEAAKRAIKVGHQLFPKDGYITMQYNMMNKKK